MKAIVYKQFGGTNVLQMVEQPTPVFGATEVLVRVRAFSINPMDWKIRKGEMKLMSGSRFAKYTGADFAGVVDGVGSGVTGLRKGDEVFGVVKNLMKQGVSADYVVVPASLVWKKPANISFPQAASIPVVGTAAITAIKKMGRIDARTSVLVNGATGGFGMFLLQLLKQKGAKVTAVAGTQTLPYAKAWGAGTLIDYSTDNVLAGNERFDVVVDLSGKMGYKNAKRIMKEKAVFLNPTPRPIEIPSSIIANLFTRQKHKVILSSPSSEATEVLLDAVRAGIDIEVNKVFPFSQFKEAYDYAERGGYAGKVVVEMDTKY